MKSDESMIDRNDLLILEALVKNARYSYAEIGRLTGIFLARVRKGY